MAWLATGKDKKASASTEVYNLLMGECAGNLSFYECKTDEAAKRVINRMHFRPITDPEVPKSPTN